MNIWFVRGAALLALAMLGACARPVQLGPGAASPGLIFTDVKYPNILNPNMDYRIVFEREDIELLGLVEAEAQSQSVLSIVSWGDSGYSTLMRRARELGGDGVMNLTIDTQYEHYVLVYTRVTMHLTGQAYRYKR